MWAHLRRLVHHLASFVAVERPRKAKIRPTKPPAAPLLERYGLTPLLIPFSDPDFQAQQLNEDLLKHASVAEVTERGDLEEMKRTRDELPREVDRRNMKRKKASALDDSRFSTILRIHCLRFATLVSGSKATSGPKAAPAGASPACDTTPVPPVTSRPRDHPAAFT